ncbi:MULTISPECIES: alpha/beta hydrolase [unclassified Streptomyces]|uniref:alpha/beta hydrolase n=1 Tax=unclassified Streptomyces TaxID=2593676 RepID=UPI00380C371D
MSAKPSPAQTPRFRGSRRIAATLMVSTLVGGVLAGCSADTDGARPAGIAWDECPPSALPPAAEGQTRDQGLDCATLEVSLDYQDPDGEKINVAVSRLSTTRPGKRRGVLLLNPGGPGSGGLGMPKAMASILPKLVLDRYDLIGFDPRGVEHSTPQSCGLPDPSVPGLFPYPAADGSITKNAAHAEAVAKKCADNAGKKLRHYNTANTARDMDRIRQALDEKKISYWGQSYGTYLGTVYRSLFQDRTDRMVLEGNVDPAKVWADQVEDTWGKSMADRFSDAARVAAAQADTLELGTNAAEVSRNYLTLADRLDRRPAKLLGASIPLDGAVLCNTTYALLLKNDTLPVLVNFWKAAENLSHGSATAADIKALQQVFAAPPPSAGIPADNQATMFMALTCGDAAWPQDTDGYAARTAADREKWPLTAGMPANIWACAFWGKPVEAAVEVVKGGSRDTLILQNRRDHATPWESGVGLHKALGKGSVYVGVDNGGHYVYGQGSACADQATVGFLSTGRLPDKDLYCIDVTGKQSPRPDRHWAVGTRGESVSLFHPE